MYSDNINVTAVPTPILPTSFELRTLRLAIAGDHFVINEVYRPPSTSVDVFFDKFADLFDAAAFIGGKVHGGDFNCPENSPEIIGDRLSAPLSCCNVVTAKNGRNMLDLIIEPDEPRRLSQATVTLTGFVLS